MELLKVVLYSTFHTTPSHNTYDDISVSSLRRGYIRTRTEELIHDKLDTFSFQRAV